MAGKLTMIDIAEICVSDVPYIVHLAIAVVVVDDDGGTLSP